ncbi:uncharacterized protein LOC127727235 isoform X3 [Mytilus californianus]|uniref:uncharacterized protein LOC127727235 isoform X2 n=1 Tax=Mytilus californianus TaxID=6549 RepID=UPI002246883E|nr:uncharacterized protein LOC127727235 isoform X2 [Mytilus californianus]XP_052090678.1 uncharacterized protein LOC127727235 isoform X3 [Mytilus californianus]
MVIVRDVKDTIIDMEEHKLSKSDKTEKKETECEIKEEEDGKDKYEEEESTPSKFAGVYSDTESEEEEEEEDDDEEDFSLGINSFIKAASQRRKQRKSKDKIEETDCGVENRILGCATYEKKYIKHKERVVHLTLVTVRKRFRKYGLGKYLLQQIIDPAIVGQYDAVVVHADNAAVEFFQKYGFSDDIVLNSRWSDLAEQFTNCTLMCYLPGFSGHSLLKTIKIPDFEVFELEQEFNKWKSKTTEVYQNQVSIVMRMKHEIIQLKALVDRQQKLIETLLRDNDRVKKERATIEKEFLDYRLGSTSITHKFSPTLIDRLDDVEDEINTEILINDLQKQVELMDLTVKRKRIESLLETDPINRSKLTTVDDCKYLSFPPAKQRNANEPYDHMKDAAFFYDVTERFKKGMKLDPDFKTRNVEVNTISKATLTDRFQEKYRDKIKGLHDPSMVADLYFCSDKMERAQDILKLGFSSSDIVAGSYGKGLYFSKFPSRASQHSKSGKVLLVEVGLGKVETVMKRDGQRQKPGAGFDSILIPGRVIRDTGNGDSTMNEEYVIFDQSQVMPLCLISMTEP